MRSPIHSVRRALRWAGRHVPIVSILVFAAALVAATWMGAIHQMSAERERGERDLALEMSNLSLALAQNVVRTASELDRILMFLRKSYERSGGKTPWQHLIKDEYTINEQTVQIAIIDRNGQMITSTAMPNPTAPIDLKDREHFRYHLLNTADQLYISKPMVGRASGKWSVQFARKILDSDGIFQGVIVVSLDPSHLARAFSSISLGDRGGVALVGHDGVIRAGSGRYLESLGKGLREGRILQVLEDVAQDAVVSRQDLSSDTLVVASRKVGDYPLEIIVTAGSLASTPAWRNKERNYYVAAGLISLFTVGAMLFAIFALRRNERRLLRVARIDGLTGLGNRLQFQESLQRLMSTGLKSGTVALHLIDLDGFKGVNDAYGHPVGDKLLKAVALRLAENTRSADLIVRLGGDEFALIQTGATGSSDTTPIGDRLCKALAEPFEIEGHAIEVGASIGIAIAGRDATTPSDLIRAADLALYCAKVGGRGCARFFQSSMQEAVVERRRIEADLKLALERSEFELFYQPIMDAPTRRVVGCEALVRWRHPTQGLVPPLTFIPVAEEAGLIDHLGAWVIRQACRDAASWPRDLWVAVNCSARQFRSGQLPRTIAAALNDSGLDAPRLEIEITESMLMQRDTETTRQLAEIRALGVSIAIDDFGTGYSSLSYLRDFPVDCVKIDRSFLSSLDKGESSSMIIKAIVAMAGAFGMRTIAEGVEHQWQLDTVASLGCNEVQGYLIGKPAPAADTIERIGPARGAPMLAA